MKSILSWSELGKLEAEDIDRINGINNPYSNLRLFNTKRSDVKLIFYRDRHAWCPYCQKIWLWLEFKRVPYQIKKINMFCYGEKEHWYLEKVRSGKLPAIELNGHIITESDSIISSLEEEYGILGSSIFSKELENVRVIERDIFRAWCEWLCRKNLIFNSSSRREKLKESLGKLEALLKSSKYGYVDPIKRNSQIEPGTGDIIFIPYIERINASLCYYKGFSLRDEYPYINKWLTLLETHSIYRGTQGDFHTHSHDLPPQMGGCYTDLNSNQSYFSNQIDNGQGLGVLELNIEDDLVFFAKFALMRVIKHKEQIINTNPLENNIFETSLRSSLSYMITGEINEPNVICSSGLRYLRDRISVPRDMPLISARLLRQALERIASISNSDEHFEIPIRHRFDQDPMPFINN